MLGEARDVVNAPINVGDYLIIRQGVHQHTLKVKEIEGKVGDARKVQAERINSTDSSMNKRTYTFSFMPPQPVMGWVIPEASFELSQQDFAQEAGVVESLVVAELITFLSKRTFAQNKADYQTCIDYLIKLNILPKREYEENKKFLSKILAAHKEIFRSKGGGWVFLKEGYSESKVLRGDPTQTPVEIDLYHLNKAIQHLLESGMLTGGRPVRFVGTQMVSE